MSDNIPVKDADLEELKREMRSAQWVEWVENNQKNLIIAAVAVLIVLMGIGLWIENDHSHRATAATTYQQAINEGDIDKKKTLLESLYKDFSDNSYGALALMHLATVDRTNAEVHLTALMNHSKATEEWIWQARLDLAEIKLAAGDSAGASGLLAEPVGDHYQQLRYYLLAQAASDENQKQDYLQKAKDAPSTLNEDLMRKIESQLSKKAS